MPATTALASRSQENMSCACPHSARARAPTAGRGPHPMRNPALFLRRRVGVDHVARLELLRVEHDLLAGDSELLDVGPLDALVLDLEHPRPGPLAVRPEAHLADDRAEL